MPGRLEGKVALITGGASGLGCGTARKFADEGARIVIADIQEELGRTVANELGDAAIFQPTDVSDENSVATAIDTAVSDFGRLDCAFANAGIIGAVGPIDEIPAEQWDATVSINLRGAFLAIKHAARVMKPQRSGVILTTTSIAAVQGGMGPHAYAATKTALVGLTRNVAAELIRYGIRVNCIAPGNMATEMISGLAFGDANRVDAVHERMGQLSPLPGRPGVPEDIANAALYLASDEAAFVSGHTLVVDAGVSTGSSDKAPPFTEKTALFREAGKRD